MLVHVDPVAAQPSAEATSTDASEPPGYRETVADAVREFAAHNFEEARSLFGRAHTLYPNARTHRGLGLAEFELRNYGKSIAHLEAALRSSVKPLSEELKSDTEHMLARANNFVARIRLDVKPGLTKLLVDKLVVEVAPGRPLLLSVGDHVLEFAARGFVSERRSLSVQGGEERTLSVILAPHTQPIASARPEQRPWYKSRWLWASVGVLAVGAAAGGAGYALSRPEKSPSPYGGTADLALKGP